jgi:hypothetical protein
VDYETIDESAGMQGRILGFGQVYLETSKDESGNGLDGGKTYAVVVVMCAELLRAMLLRR